MIMRGSAASSNSDCDYECAALQSLYSGVTVSLSVLNMPVTGNYWVANMSCKTWTVVLQLVGDDDSNFFFKKSTFLYDYQ